MIKNREVAFTGKSPEEIFKMVYDVNDWSSEESKSGMGSTLKFTENTRAELPIICKKYGIKRILDVACGDFNWMKEIVDNFEYYKGLDIVEDLIDQNNKKYKVKNRVEFSTCNILDGLQLSDEFDAILAKDVLVHFPEEYVKQALQIFKESGVKYLILTNFIELEKNTSIDLFGLWRPLNFELEPFKMGTPLEIIKEESEDYIWNSAIKKDKTLSLWKIN